MRQVGFFVFFALADFADTADFKKVFPFTKLLKV